MSDKDLPDVIMTTTFYWFLGGCVTLSLTLISWIAVTIHWAVNHPGEYERYYIWWAFNSF